VAFEPPLFGVLCDPLTIYKQSACCTFADASSVVFELQPHYVIAR